MSEGADEKETGSEGEKSLVRQAARATVRTLVIQAGLSPLPCHSSCLRGGPLGVS